MNKSLLELHYYSEIVLECLIRQLGIEKKIAHMLRNNKNDYQNQLQLSHTKCQLFVLVRQLNLHQQKNSKSN